MRDGARGLTAGWIALSLLLACASASPPETAARAGTAPSVPDGWLASAQRHIAEREYRASRNRMGLQAPNRAHDLRTYFGPRGIRVHDRSDPGSPELLALSLEGVGRGGALSAPGPGEVSSEGARVEIRRGSLVEWYENSPNGLEQGFTLDEPPPGAGPLVLELAVRGAALSLEGDEVELATAQGRDLRYGGLEAWDATGTRLDARLRVAGTGRLRLEVDDAGAAYPVVVDPFLTADGAPQIESNQARAYLGFSVAGAGDVNGDGYDDIIVGAHSYDAGETDEGAAFVFLGGPAGIAGDGPATAHAQLESDQAAIPLDPFISIPPSFGHSVAGAGDVNGDGYDDVVVGAFTYAPDYPNSPDGAAFVFLGGPAGIADGSPATAHAHLDCACEQSFPDFGSAVASAGDVNGDGYDDLLVGAAGLEPGGEVYLFLGSATGIPSGGPAAASTRLVSDQDGAAFGASVSGAGDVNDDGYDDVLVGALLYDAGETDEGAAFVFLGGPAGIPDGGPASAHARLESDATATSTSYSYFGKVAAAGDVDGDGYDDVLVGAQAYGSTDTLPGGGAAFLFHGSAAGIASGGPATANTRLEASQERSLFGTSIAGAGDVNGDGYDDVVVGAARWDGDESDEGAAFVFLGAPAGIAHGGPASADAVIEADQPGARVGISVAGAGDVNGDGAADLVIGADLYDAGEPDEGGAIVLLPEPGALTSLLSGIGALAIPAVLARTRRRRAHARH